MIDNEPWYSSGLLFTCVHCGRCCRRQGVVRLAPGELADIAGHLGLSNHDYLRYFVTDREGNTYIRDGSKGECVFLDWESGVCRVYAYRPDQCRRYPFWPSITESPSAWQNEGRFCPGIGRGKRYSMNSIDNKLNKQNLP